jgi:hypothetical protein
LGGRGGRGNQENKSGFGWGERTKTKKIEEHKREDSRVGKPREVK